MAVDRAIDSTEFDSKLTTVADAIRTAGGTTEPMSFPSGMVSAISELKSGGVEPFTKIISGTITFAEATTAFQLPETENFLAAYFIRTDFWVYKMKYLIRALRKFCLHLAKVLAIFHQET